MLIWRVRVWPVEVSCTKCLIPPNWLDACRFQGCDIWKVRLPRWPCFTFTFMDPRAHAASLGGRKWLGRFGSVVIKNLATQPPSAVAVTYHAPSVAELLETTPEELRAALGGGLECVVM